MEQVKKIEKRKRYIKTEISKLSLSKLGLPKPEILNLEVKGMKKVAIRAKRLEKLAIWVESQ